MKEEMSIELDELRRQDLLWNPRTLNGPSTARTTVDNKEVLVLCFNI